jgi:hypothetical protein
VAEPRAHPAPAGARHAIPRQRRRAAGKAPRLHRHRPEAADEDLAATARALAVRSRRAQGLPDHITDPATLDELAQLVAKARAP